MTKLQFNERFREIRWSSGSCGNPGCTDPECVCALCAKPIGTPDEVLEQNGHDDEFCMGCDLCRDRVPIILFRGEGAAMMQAAFHGACFETMLVPIGAPN